MKKLILVMKNGLLIILLACARLTDAQTWVTIPDANFAAYLQGIIPSAMNGNQLNISSTLVTTRDSIDVPNKNIGNLSGIQYFTSITYLNCGINPLYSLPTLPNSIEFLLCLDNHLTSLPILPTSLQLFDCHNNDIACFPTFPNSIRSINLINNPFNCLPNYVLPYMNSYTTTPLCAAGNTNGCAVTGISQYSNLNTQISIYPNPNNGSFVIETNATIKQTIMVYDVTGKLVLTQTINGKTTIDASTLNEGVYNISINSSEGVINKKVVIIK